MKLSILACAISVVMVTASPGASSLKRGFKWVNVAGEVNPIQIACYECPCDGFSGKCECIPQGCCCDWSQPTTTGWVGAQATAAQVVARHLRPDLNCGGTHEREVYKGNG